jgi:hypothetical protein
VTACCGGKARGLDGEAAGRFEALRFGYGVFVG